MNRRCVTCRLPNDPHTVYLEHIDAEHAVLAICDPCRAKLSGIPRSSAQASIRRAAVRAAQDPQTYWIALFQDAGAARLAMGMLRHVEHTEGAARAIGWLEDETEGNSPLDATRQPGDDSFVAANNGDRG